VSRQHSLPSRPGLRARAAAGLVWLPLGVAVADWLALKTGLLGHEPWVVAVLVGVAALSLLVRSVWLVRRLVAGRGSLRLAGASEVVLIVGVLMALGAGTANWLLSLQGFVVLHEGESVPLGGGRHLQELVGGPLARIEEMEVVIGLQEVELLPVGPVANRSFVPRSKLVVEQGGEEGRSIEVEPRHLAAVGPLRFHQGAFGFAPRIIIEREGRTLFDEVVPFTTERRGPTGVLFEGAFTLERESLAMDGWIDLASLDEGMRGHATLDLSVRRDGELLGRGRLLPGHFAEVGDGYGIGFAGLRRWSEIDISRRDYSGGVLAGGAIAALGVIGLMASAVRRVRRRAERPAGGPEA